LPRFSINRPVTILMVYVAVTLVGLISLARLPVELMPNYSFGDISVIVDVRGGMPPQEVETQVATLVEDAVGDVGHLRDIISISEEGRARVALKFEPGTNMDYAGLEVREKMSRVKDKLPSECEKPVIAKFEQSDMPVFITAVAGSGQTPEQLRKFVDDHVRDRLMRLEGVANVEVGGGRERKIIVDVDQQALNAYGIPMSRLVQALGSSNLNMVVGAWDASWDARYLVRLMAEFADVEDIKNIPVSAVAANTVVRLKDVARVSDSYLEAKSFARVNAMPVVSVYVQKESSANTIKVCAGVLKEIAGINKSFGLADLGIRFITTYNQAEAIHRAINSVRDSLLWGAIFAALVLVFFLKDIRSLLIIGVTMPISLAAAFAMMYLSPQMLTLNVMTLSGLALGVGMLVDNAIVVLDNILKLRRAGVELKAAAGQGTEQMMSAIVASTLTTVVVFLPIIFISKEIRLLYAGFGLVIFFSLAASLAAAITLVPMLYARFFKQDAGIKPEPLRFLSQLKTYRKALVAMVRYRFFVVAGVVLCFAAALVLFICAIPKEFVGSSEQDDFTVFVELPTGAKVDISNAAVRDVEKILSSTKEVKTVSSRIEPWSSKVFVKLKPLKSRSRSNRQILEDLRPRLKAVENSYKEAFVYFEQPQDVESNEVIIDIYGQEYDKLNDIAMRMLSRMEKIKGLNDLKVRWRKGRPEWQVIVDGSRAALYGLTTNDVAQALHSQMRGLRATLYRVQGKRVEVISRFAQAARDTLAKLKKMTIETPDGRKIYLEEVASFKPEIGAGKIWRKNKNRMIQISANRGQYAFGAAVEKIKKSLQGLELEPDYFYRFGENYTRMLENQRELTIAVGLMLVLVFMVLAALYESYAKPFIIMTTVPMAFIGAVALLFVSRSSANIGVLMGLVMLGGVVVSHAVVMVDRITRLESRIGVLRAAITGAGQRVIPVLSTALTTILGMLPLAVDRGEDSALWSPLALTVIGGMIAGTCLTLLVVPAVYVLFNDFRRKSTASTA